MAATEARIAGIHHVEIYVSNNRQASYFFRSVLGFRTVGVLQPEGPAPDRLSLALERGDVRLLLTSPLTASSEVAEHIRLHGEGIRDIAFAVDDVTRVFERAIAHGARPAANSRACVEACGDLVHSFIERRETPGPWLPGIVANTSNSDTPDLPDTALDAIDHIALALPAGELDRWVDFYVNGLGLTETHQEAVSTEYSAMRSKVVATPDGAVRFPMMEPAAGRRKSQIETYIESHQGPGAQHLALRSHDIVQSVTTMACGIEFLATPSVYYDGLEARVGDLSSELEALRRHGILVDRDATGILLQVFSKPLGTRPTLFLEVIERRGAHGFGSGNIKALFEAVERTLTAGSAAS